MIEMDPAVGKPDVTPVKVKRPKKTQAEAPEHAKWCHEVVLDNVRGSENYHVCVVRVDTSPYMHFEMHACPCGFVWGYAGDGKPSWAKKEESA